MQNIKLKMIFIFLIILLLFTILWATTQGAAGISINEGFYLLLKKIPLLSKVLPVKELPKSYYTIIYNITFPRIKLILFAGAGLSIAGAVFQSVFRNPMADPYVIGVSSGAALGATLAIILGLNHRIWLFSVDNLFAFVSSMITVAVVFKIASVGNKTPSTTLLLTGISFNYLLSSIINLLMFFNREHLEKIYTWTLGSFSTANWSDVVVTALVVIICSAILYIFAKDLNIILLGENNAKSLGIDVEKMKKIVLIIASFMISIIVSATGIIGFVGLIIPHISRIIIGPDHKNKMPLAWLMGAIFMILCDTIARSILPPKEISVGIITSLFGVPFFVYLLQVSKKKVVK